jgi:methylglutaconyl-CoA hydratase
MSGGPSVLRTERGGPGGSVATVTLARPEVRNAFNAELIAALQEAFGALATESAEALRAVVLAGDGPIFCSGADVEWQRAARNLTMEQNQEDASRLFDMLSAIDACPAPVIARVQGAALGGGMALCAVSDIVVATASARFGFTETRLGILPAVISPFVIPKIGETHARALFPAGERFDAERALEIGLVHEVVKDEGALAARIDGLLAELLAAGPTAARAAKRVIRDLRDRPKDEARSLVTELAARQRVSPEGQEGLTAFLEKRPASWRSD